MVTAASKRGQNAPSSAEFLGVDPTLPANWETSYGIEGWVLFAIDAGADLCGGPHLLDSTFSYRPYVGDPTNAVRHWRDPFGYRSRPTDVPLDDPTLASESVVSFLDDNGEAYPVNAGPGLYVNVRVPKGKHILTIPLHFSDPAIHDAKYKIYLLAANASGSAGPAPRIDADVDCLATYSVSAASGAKCVRAAVSGPARYVVVIRGIDALNANLPALFLDPDRRSVELHQIIEDFTDHELSDVGAVPARPRADGMIVAPDYNSNSYALSKLLKDYMTAVRDDERTLPHSEITNAELWASWKKQAATFVGDDDLTDLQRAAAQWLVWRASEADPLRGADAVTAYAQYLELRYPVRGAQEDSVIENLRSKSAYFRSVGEIGYAEATDDHAWNIYASAEGLDKAGSESAAGADIRLNALWNNGPRLYLAGRTIWVWQGDGGAPPRDVDPALDVGYAARRARSIVRAILYGLPMTLPQSVASAVTTTSGGPRGVVQAQQWIDAFSKSNGITMNSGIATVRTTQRGNGGPGSQIDQSVNPILYAAACEPLDGGDSFEQCLLRPDQMETLARALINGHLFAVDDTRDAVRTLKLLDALQLRYPAYPRAAQIAGIRESAQAVAAK